jgi:hypothetical protein
MNIFELAFWGGILWLLFLGSSWLSKQLEINQWVIFPILVVLAFVSFEIVGRYRRKK